MPHDHARNSFMKNRFIMAANAKKVSMMKTAKRSFEEG